MKFKIGETVVCLSDNKPYVIDDYSEDVCGQGCCSGYHLKDYKDNSIWFRETQLRKIYYNEDN